MTQTGRHVVPTDVVHTVFVPEHDVKRKCRESVPATRASQCATVCAECCQKQHKQIPRSKYCFHLHTRQCYRASFTKKNSQSSLRNPTKTSLNLQTDLAESAIRTSEVKGSRPHNGQTFISTFQFDVLLAVIHFFYP
jgi:hypothetical protein